MNMVWLLLLLILAVWEGGRPFKKGLICNIQINAISETGPNGRGNQPLKYDAAQLMTIKTRVEHDKSLRRLPFEAIRTIKHLKINKRRIRLSKSWSKLSRKINLNNLQQVQIDPELPDLSSKNVKLATVNIRSLKSKSDYLMEILNREQIDILVITESWLKNTEEDTIWLESQEFTKLYNCSNIPRKGKKRGGGLLLLVKKNLKIKLLETINHLSYEGAVWKIHADNKQFIVFGVYHPPAVSTGVPNTIFADVFIDKVTQLLGTYNNLISLGDFNIHVNDPTDADAIYLLDAMSAINFDQIVINATHRLGNTLDIIFKQNDANITVKRVTVSDMVSDHRIVLGELNIGRPKLQIKEVTSRKFDDKFSIELERRLNTSAIMMLPDLDKTLAEYERIIQSCITDLAVIKTVKVCDRKRVPWFTSNTREQRKIVRNAERRWLKYGHDHQWLAYKRERNRYNNMIQYSKSQIYCDKITKAHGDTKKLYQITEE